MTIIDLARKFLFVREAKEQNAGARVEAIQRWGGGQKGDSWCAFWATMVLDLYFEGASPIPRTGSCDDILNLARERNWLSEIPHVGDLYLYLKTDTDAHHVGIVTDVNAAGYIGIIGSKRRWQTSREKLLAMGVPEEKLNRVNSPMGLELNAETPEEIALSILAEIVMLRRGGDGGRMGV